MKRVIVVGASSGIGKGLAKLLALNNYKVGIAGRRTELLSEMKQENPNSFFLKTIDITDTIKAVQQLEELVIDLGGLDLVVISSGTGDLNEQLDFEIEKLTIDTNVTGFTCIADWAFNHFQKQKSGHLSAISSIGGLRGSGYCPSYNASKAYQINYLEGLQQKVNKLKMQITITDIRAGFVDTAMAKSDRKFWVATVEKASQQILDAIKNKKKVVYVTKRWRLFAMLLKLIPSPIYERL